MTESTEIAILAGGCFWGSRSYCVSATASSRPEPDTRAETPNATYRNHEGHAEAVEIVFDPERISYRDILEFFFQIHDPTTMNRQGNDIGSSYRSEIFHTSDEQRQVAEETIADVEARPLAGQGRDRRQRGRHLLGGRARAPGLPAEVPRRLHLSLRAPRLEAASPRTGRVVPTQRGQTPFIKPGLNPAFDGVGLLESEGWGTCQSGGRPCLFFGGGFFNAQLQELLDIGTCARATCRSRSGRGTSVRGHRQRRPADVRLDHWGPDRCAIFAFRGDLPWGERRRSIGMFGWAPWPGGSSSPAPAPR